jgi:hypothetical protein
VTNAIERRCKATSRSGNACRATVVNAAGFCVAHDPEKPMDMRALGRKSGEARRKPNPERVPASLREELRTLDPAVVKAAIEETLSSANQSAKVAAVKLLADVDAFKQSGDECPRCAAWKAEAPGAAAKVDRMISRLVESAMRDEFDLHQTEALRTHARGEESDSRAMTVVRGAVQRVLDEREQELRDAVQTALGKVLDAIANGLVVDNVVDADRAAEVLQGLEEVGLIVPRGRLEEMAEARALELLASLKAEHGIPA